MCEKLRADYPLAQRVQIFLQTHPHQRVPQRRVQAVGDLHFATAETPTIFQLAKQLLNSLYQPDYRYYKVGIVLTSS